MRLAPLAALLAVLAVAPSAAPAIELGAAPGTAAPIAGKSQAPALRRLVAELGRWNREINGEALDVDLRLVAGDPLRLAVTATAGGLRVTVGEAFMREPALTRVLTALLLGLSRYDRHGDKAVVERAGLAGRTV